MPLGLFDDYSEADFERTGLRVSLGAAYALLNDAPRDHGILGEVPRDGGTTDMQVATADQDDWPYVSGRFLKPDTIVSVDIAERWLLRRADAAMYAAKQAGGKVKLSHFHGHSSHIRCLKRSWR